jgi:hypothetical protein
MEIVDQALTVPPGPGLAAQLARLASRSLADGLDRTRLTELMDADGVNGAWVAWIPAGSGEGMACLEQCLHQAIPEPAQAAAVFGDPFERSRLLDGLARRCGIRLAEDLLAAAPPWWFTAWLGTAMGSGPRSAGLSRLLRDLPSRSDQRTLRRMPGELRGQTGNFGVSWPARPAEVVEAVWAARRGDWIEMAWVHPRIDVFLGDSPMGPAAARVEGTLVRRCTGLGLRPMRPVEVEEVALADRSPWSVRSVRRVAEPHLGIA